MSDEKNKVTSDELKELREKDSQEIKLAKALGLLVALVLLSIVHNFYSIFQMWTDDSVVFVQCPRQFTLDRPVIMKKMSDSSNLQLDNWVRSFAINFTMKLHPRTAEDAEVFFEYIKNHTEGYNQKKYEARLNDIEDIKKQIKIGNRRKFYIKNSNEIQIRKIKGQVTKWKVVIFGYLHSKTLTGLEKTQPRVELIIRPVKPTIYNPEGLLVESFDIIAIKDAISGEEVSL
jgi:hypothetical protein